MQRNIHTTKCCNAHQSFNLTRNYRRTNCFRYTLPPGIMHRKRVREPFHFYNFFVVCYIKKTIFTSWMYKNLDKELQREIEFQMKLL